LVGLDSEDLTRPSSLASLGILGIDSVEEDLGVGFATIEEAVQAIKEGKFVLVVDDENRENEGDLIMAGSLVTPQAMAFLVRHSTGIVCVSMKGEDLDRIGLPLMVPEDNNAECMKTAFTWTVDAKQGTTTGVSAADRCQTILKLASPDSAPGDFVAPGHVFPLRYREGGVLKRRGHTEAALDLTELAGLPPAGVLCEVVNDEDGSMARLPYLMKFAKQHGLPIVSIDALVKFKEEAKKCDLVHRTARARLPTEYGEFQVFSYESTDGLEHAALVEGDISSGMDVYVRIHSECLTGDVFRSTRCDCGSQLSDSLAFIKKMGRGVVVYMRGHEGRGIGLGHKMRAYNLQDAGSDTVEANLQLGLPVDSREYGISAQILQDLGVKTITLLSNNPEKVRALKEHGIGVNERRSIFSPVTKENRRYLETKRIKMGHMYTSRLPAVGIDVDNSTNDESERLT
jgi:3,4-dihydroxy 2-butanone 4-phosphate synthase/GTP cyclohydrolase II